jgi:hypothetical protein
MPTRMQVLEMLETYSKPCLPLTPSRPPIISGATSAYKTPVDVLPAVLKINQMIHSKTSICSNY